LIDIRYAAAQLERTFLQGHFYQATLQYSNLKGNQRRILGFSSF
jgi:hypothetical protein